MARYFADDPRDTDAGQFINWLYETGWITMTPKFVLMALKAIEETFSVAGFDSCRLESDTAYPCSIRDLPDRDEARFVLTPADEYHTYLKHVHIYKSRIEFETVWGRHIVIRPVEGAWGSKRMWESYVISEGYER